MAMINSMIVDEDDVSEKVVKELVDQLNELSENFKMELILTVIITPDYDSRYRKFAHDLWSCWG